MSDKDGERWHALSRFLDEVLDLPEQERDTWLEKFRAEHPQHAQDLQAHLARLKSLDEQGFLEDDPARLLNLTSLEGQRLGVYTIESLIGRGGMGSVWRARRNDGHFEGHFAIKLLNLSLRGGGWEERFRREGRMLARLTHPNIARIIDAGVMSGGQLYLVLEYVEGGDIDRYCDERRLDVEARIKLFLDVLAAVAHAHANLIVHRDIKPANIQVTHDGVVKLLDFGVAKLLETEGALEAPLNRTQEDMRAVTPRYAAPEQLLGTPITVATDVYALGVLLYVLLTGQYPTGEKSTSTLQHMHLLLNTEASRLSDAATAARTCEPDTVEENSARRATTPLKLRRLLRGDLDNIVAKALKKNSQERYSSVKEFADDLRRYLNNEPVLARGDNTWYRARKFVVRNRLLVALSSAALSAVLATAGIALFEANSAEMERDRALALSSRNEAVAAFLNTLITEAAAAGKPVAVSDMLDRSEALARSTYQTSPEHRAAVLSMLGSYYQANGKDARAESLMREALEAIRTSSDRDLRRQITCDHAGTLTFLGKAPEAIRVLNDVVADPHTTARQAAQCLDYLTQAALEQNDPAGALKFATLALERLHQSVDPLPLQEALLLNSMAFAEGLSGRNDLAGQFFARSLALYARAGREHSADAIAIRNNWAIISEKAGDPRRALDLFEQSLRMVAENDPRGEPPPYLIGNRARALEMLGRYRDSRQAYGQCIAAAVQAGAIRAQANCLLGAASSSRGLGDLSAAEESVHKMSAIVSASLPTSTEAFALPVIRGRIALARGQLAEARTNLDLAIANGKVASLKTNALLSRAELNLDENKLPAAQADARQALALAQTAQGGIPYSNHTGLAWLMLGRVLAKQGETVPARNAFQTAIEHLSNTVDSDHPMLVLARELVQR